MANNLTPKSAAPEKDIILDHIDKLYSTVSRIWDSLSRIFWAETILSIFILALSTGIISVNEEVEISGLTFKLSLAVLLSGGAFLIGTLSIALASQFRHAQRLQNEIKGLYHSLGYKKPSLALDADAFEIPSILFSVIAPSVRLKESSALATISNILIAAITFFGLVLILPVGAQIAAGLKVAALFAWRWWILALFSVLVMLTVGLLFIRLVYDEAFAESLE